MHPYGSVCVGILIEAEILVTADCPTHSKLSYRLHPVYVRPNGREVWETELLQLLKKRQGVPDVKSYYILVLKDALGHVIHV